jgi:hypothetical protein
MLRNRKGRMKKAEGRRQKNGLNDEFCDVKVAG